MALTIGYVHDDPGPSAGDLNLVSLLEARGHTVDLLPEGATNPPPAGYDAFLVSESGSGSTVGNFTSTTTGVLCFETAWDTLGIATTGASSQGSSATWDLEPHPITNGLPDPLTVHGGGGNYGVATTDLAAGVTLVASVNAGASAVLAVSDTVAPGPRGCAALIDSRTGSITSGGVDLIEATLEWMAPSAPAPASGSATGSVTWSGTAAGTAPPVPAHSGSATAGWSVSGTASGSTTNSGQATGTFDWTGTASGRLPARGTASGGWLHSGAARGSTPHRGRASGAHGWTGQALGTAPAVTPAHGTATGTFSWAGQASGHAGPVEIRDLRILATAPPASPLHTTVPAVALLTATGAATRWTSTGPGSGWTDTEPAVDPLAAAEPALLGPATTEPGSTTTTSDPEL